MKELPYFKFYTGEWMKGDITDCTMAAQGLFINVCGLYWSRGCNLDLTRVERKFNSCSTELKELLDDEIISVIDGKIVIDFLNEQFEYFLELSNKKSLAGQASAKTRKVNRRSTDVKQVMNNKEERRGDNNKNKRVVFKPPTIDEVKSYCLERKNRVDWNKWYNHYTANGWMVGKNKMKDWKAAVRTWEGNEFNKPEITGRNIKSEKAPENYGILPEGDPMPESLRKKFKIGEKK